MKTIKVQKYVGGPINSYQAFNYSIKDLISSLKVGNIYVLERLNASVIINLRLPFVELTDLLEVLKND